MTTPAPFFTVVVPSHHRREALLRCLEALAGQDFPREAFEVVVVDDGSPVPPQDIIAGFDGRLQVRLLEQRRQGPAAARNAGAWAARGRYLAFTDDDCRPESTWLGKLATQLGRHPDCAIGGRVVNALTSGPYPTASQLLVDYLYQYYNAGEGEARFFITSNLSFPAAAFRAMGGFDTTFLLSAAEDRDVCDRWRERGGSMLYAEDAVVQHAHALRFRSFCRQHYNYGRGAHYLHRARSRRGETRLRVEPFRFYAGLVAYPWTRTSGARAPILCTLAALSQAAYAAGYLRERIFGRRRVTSGA